MKTTRKNEKVKKSRVFSFLEVWNLHWQTFTGNLIWTKQQKTRANEKTKKIEKMKTQNENKNEKMNKWKQKMEMKKWKKWTWPCSHQDTTLECSVKVIASFWHWILLSNEIVGKTSLLWMDSPQQVACAESLSCVHFELEKRLRATGSKRGQTFEFGMKKKKLMYCYLGLHPCESLARRLYSST